MNSSSAQIRLIDELAPVKPLLKWAGGKRNLVSTLHELFPSDWRSGSYYEPFFGGGAVFFSLLPDSGTLSDLNPHLINFYAVTQKHPQSLYASIHQIANNFDAENDDLKQAAFIELRKKFNSGSLKNIESAATFYSLNKLCFNGLYRENSKGYFNVPFGNKKSFPRPKEQDFLTVSNHLKKVSLLHTDFSNAVIDSSPGDFIYFDPPYIPLSATSSFTSYSSGGFSVDEQKRLSELLTCLASNGVRAMVSNSDTKLTREIYSEHRFEVISASRMVSATSKGRGTVKELVIMNY